MEQLDARGRLIFPKQAERAGSPEAVPGRESRSHSRTCVDRHPVPSTPRPPSASATRPRSRLLSSSASSKRRATRATSSSTRSAAAAPPSTRPRSCGRRWIGIDITYLAIDLIRKRLRHTYGDDVEATYTVHGIPADAGGAAALFHENPFDFERWAVSLIDGQPNEKQVGDKGIDGRVRFHADKDRIGQVLVSVKGGQDGRHRRWCATYSAP